MSAHDVAALFAWLTIGQWLIISILFVSDAVRVHLRTARSLKNARAVGNGRVMVAEVRNTISWWYILGSAIALTLGILGAGQQAFTPTPAPEFRLVGSVIREGIVVMLFSFWMTKRGNARIFRLMDARYNALVNLEDMAEDTNVRVREIQKRGQHDQPEEQADRQEGRGHRGVEE